MSDTINNLLEVAGRLKPNKVKEINLEDDLIQFCKIYTEGSIVVSVVALTGGVEALRALTSSSLHAGIAIGMRYAHDYGVPNVVLGLFEELQMFGKEEK